MSCECKCADYCAMEEQYCINDIANVIARVLSEVISRFHSGELVAALLRQEIYR